MRSYLFGFLLVVLGMGTAHAQPASCANGILNPYSIHIGTGPCDVAGGSALANEITQREAAIAAITSSSFSLGTMASQNANAVNITGGTATGMTVIGGAVPSNTALKALATTGFVAGVSVTRSGFTTPGDGGIAQYTWSTSPCSLNAGAGDNGAQVAPTVGTGCWNIVPASTYNAKIWGVVCDGVTNDAPAFNTALTYLANTKGTLFVSGPVCAIASTLTAAKWSGISLLGNGDGNYGRAATTLLWTGASGGLMLDWSSAGDAYVTAGSHIEGILFKGNNLAGTAIKIRNLTKSSLSATILNTTAIAVDEDVAGTAYTGDVSLNRFPSVYIDQSGSTGAGWVIGPGTATQDTNSNVWDNLTIITAGATAFSCQNADANTVIYLRTQGPAGSGTTGSGTTIGLDLKGSVINSTNPTTSGACRYNTFIQAQIYGIIQTELGVGGFPATGNTILSTGIADSFTKVVDNSSGLNVIGTDSSLLLGLGGIGIGTKNLAQSLDIENLNPFQMRLGASGTSMYSYDIGRSTVDGKLYFYGNQSGANGFVFGGINGTSFTITPTSVPFSVPAYLEPLLVSALPSTCLPGATVYATNGRNSGQGSGAGTGLNVTCDSTNVWRASWSGLAVTQ